MSAMVEQVTAVRGTREEALLTAPGFFTQVSQLVHAHRARLLAYARRRGLDPEEALDAVQDSFVSFLELPAARTVARESVDSLKFLTVILGHNVQNQVRKRTRRRRTHGALESEGLSAEQPSSETLIASAEEFARMSGCILQMAKLEREVVMLSLFDEETRDRVADVLGISQGYLRVLLHRARAHLRQCSLGGEPLRAVESSAESLGAL